MCVDSLVIHRGIDGRCGVVRVLEIGVVGLRVLGHIGPEVDLAVERAGAHHAVKLVEDGVLVPLLGVAPAAAAVAGAAVPALVSGHHEAFIGVVHLPVFVDRDIKGVVVASCSRPQYKPEVTAEASRELLVGVVEVFDGFDGPACTSVDGKCHVGAFAGAMTK